MSLLVERVELLATIQDLGRPGLGHLGVSPSGAFDRPALRQANALVGNDMSVAGIECLRGGLTLRATVDHLVAVTGAAAALSIDARPVEHGRTLHLPTGSTLTIGVPPLGLRTYLAVAGGVAVDPVLGSRSTDTLADLGPPRLAAGTELPVGTGSGPGADLDVLWAPRLGEATVEVVLGPRDSYLTSEALGRLLGEPWTLTDHCDRIGLRLSGPALERAVTDEVPSEPCARGSIQITADGTPIVFGPDHPVTGGYPVAAVVIDAHTDRLAQLGPGDTLRFTPRFVP